MKVKNKLRLGFGFLFVVVILFGAAALYYIDRISYSAKIILKDNYNSLDYVRGMRTVIDENAAPLPDSAAAAFRTLLSKEEHNITEPGELSTVKHLRASFTALQQASSAEQRQGDLAAIKSDLQKIDRLNMDAIMLKSKNAEATVYHAAVFLGLVAGLTFLVLFSFIVNFPGYIANPLNALLRGIREVSRLNYKQRIEYSNNDEFAEVAAAFNEMALRLNEWEDTNASKLQSQTLRIETIIEQMRDPIFGVTAANEVLFMNTAAKELLAIGAYDLKAKNVDDLAANNELLAMMVNATESNKLFKIVRNAKELHFQLETREIMIPANNSETNNVIARTKISAGRVYLLRNITEFKERDMAKTNFIATISHELKTPISSIKMSLSLLADKRVGELNAEQQQLQQNMADDADRLLKITSELLNMAQVETGNIQLNFTMANAASIINYAVNAVKQNAEGKSVTIEQIIPENMPAVYADVEKTAWVLINFLSNAVRYAPQGSVIVVQVGIKNDRLEFSVKDSGKGIEEQYQERLFERYFKIPADGDNRGGNGLGLAIAKEFITAQGGNIGVQSKPMAGSRFYFSLPVKGD